MIALADAVANTKELSPKELSSLQFWALIMAAASVVAWVVMTYARKRAGQMLNSAQHLAYTLDDLRRMHREGVLTDEEFARAKAKTLATSRETERRKAEAKARKLGLKLDLDTVKDSDINGGESAEPDLGPENIDPPNSGGSADR